MGSTSRFSALSGNLYMLQTTDLASGVDTLLEIYGTDGVTVLASDDNSGGEAASRLKWQAPMDGTYFIRVAQASGSAFGCNATYDISIVRLQEPLRADITGPITGVIQSGYTFTATASPITATLPITYVWQATGQAPVTSTDGLSDTITFTWSTTGTQVITATVTNAAGTITGTHAITIGAAPSPPCYALTDVVLAGPPTTTVGLAIMFTAAVSPPTTTLPVTYTWQATCQTPIIHTGDLSDTVQFTWAVTGTQTVTMMAVNECGVGISTTRNITVQSAKRYIYLPLVLGNY